MPRRAYSSSALLAVALLMLEPLVVAGQEATPTSIGASWIVRAPAGDLRGSSDGIQASWLGVPYAAAPVGDLRWRPPAAPATWDGVRDATTLAEPCLQLDAPTDAGP